DQVWPDRARAGCAFDHRFMLGYLRKNPCAILLAPLGTSALYDINGDEDTAQGTTQYLFQLTDSLISLGSYVLTLKKVAAGVTTSRTFSNVYTDLQGLVDAINSDGIVAGVPNTSSGQWGAQVVPGADVSATAINLAFTNVGVNHCTATGTTLVAGGARDFT